MQGVNENEVVEISKENFNILCVCSVRYAIGRRSYMPSLIVDLLNSRMNDLTDNTIKLCIEDIEFQETINSLGSGCDIQLWLDFKDRLKFVLERRHMN